MTRSEFLTLLKSKGIEQTNVLFDDSVNDGYCVYKNHLRWEVFYRERGKEYDSIGFPSESDALDYLYSKLLRYYDKT